MPEPKSPRSATAKKIVPVSEAPVLSGSGHVSKNQLATLLGRSNSVIDGWIRAKCPFVQKADKPAGKDWIFDIGDVVRWREKKISEETLQRHVDEDSEAASPQSLVALATSQLKLEENRRQLVRQAISVATMERHHALVRQAVMTLPLKYLDLLQGLDQLEHNRLHGLFVDIAIDGLEDAAKVIKDYDAATSPTG